MARKQLRDLELPNGIARWYVDADKVVIFTPAGTRLEIGRNEFARRAPEIETSCYDPHSTPDCVTPGKIKWWINEHDKAELQRGE